MTKRTIVLWNLETFGNYFVRDTDEVILWFMCKLKQSYEIDVMMVQELRKKGLAALPKAATILATPNYPRGTEDPWLWDAVPGAILPASNQKSRAELKLADFGFLQTGNNEGYAVLARQGALDTFTADHSYRGATQSGTGVINLLLTGIDPVLDARAEPPIAPNANGDKVRACFPRPRPDLVPQTEGVRHSERIPVVRPLEPLRWSACRRPCIVKVKLGQQTVHVLTYHAPVDGYGAVYGSLACGLSEPIRDSTNFPNVVVGGDFNVFNEAAQGRGFANFYSANMKAGTTRSNQYQQTMVRYTVDNQGQALLPDDSPCLGNPRDFLFYSTGVSNFSISSGCWNLVDWIKSDKTLTFQKNEAVRKGVIDSLSKMKFPKVEATLWPKLLSVFANQTPFPDNITAAYFYRLFISDHLPVYIVIDDQK